MNYVLLLTACINPDGMPYTQLSDKGERLRQYFHAIDFYLQSTNLPIVFVENSNTDISKDYSSQIKKGRLEVITFDGNHDKKRGKGFGEANIIEQAMIHSTHITEDCIVVKITGRLIVNNIIQVLKKPFPLQQERSVNCSFHSNMMFADSRFFCAPPSFLRYLTSHKDKMNDSQGVFFEHVLAECTKTSNIPNYPFWTEPSIIGVSGTSGEIYTKNDNSPCYKLNYRLFVLHQAISFCRNSDKYPYICSWYFKILYVLHIFLRFIIE
jgi:hypothetical protein